MSLDKSILEEDLKIGIALILGKLLPPALEESFKIMEDRLIAGFYQDKPLQAKADCALDLSRVLVKAFSNSLSIAISEAVDAFIRTATVTTPAGVPVAVVHGIPRPGVTTAPGIGTIS